MKILFNKPKSIFLLGFFLLLIISGAAMSIKKNGSLSDYKKKRNFKSTSEPKGEKKTTQDKQRIFVIQKHNASHVHYDLRLEVNGVLKSWAVPKGPSTNPEDKQLAVNVEDHPYDYAHFEGTIAQGNYGAGTVMVWDHGYYRNLREEKEVPISMEQSYKEGKIEFFLQGHKLCGSFALIRMHNNDKNWLLIKMKDAFANKPKNPVKNLKKSSLSSRTMTQIKKEGVVYE